MKNIFNKLFKRNKPKTMKDILEEESRFWKTMDNHHCRSWS